jgi:hypothetical protein
MKRILYAFTALALASGVSLTVAAKDMKVFHAD